MASAKLFYPSANEIGKLSKPQLAIKIARHSNCGQCDDCSGLRPPPDVEVALDESQLDTSLNDLTQYGSEDEESMDDYLQECTCGHDARAHGADESTLGRTEFLRRARVAIRLDEFLEDEGKLLDFEYTNEAIIGLRPQMTLPTDHRSPELEDILSPDDGRILSSGSSSLSDVSFTSPPSKRQREDDRKSLSDAALDDSDEDEPLAARLPPTQAASKNQPHSKKSRTPAATRGRPRRDGPQRMGGKKIVGKGPPSKKAKSSTAPALLPPPTVEEQVAMNNQVSGINGQESKIKVEETMDEGQLNRLATGVTVDLGAKTSSATINKPEKLAHVELRKGIIKIEPVENDKSARSWILLTQLKTLFQKQLPKMPREYIARLVYDSNSRCMAILKRGLKVVGGICFRPFPHRGFAEIVFFATNSVDQVKGYGSMLMDHFKAHIRKTYPDMMHFLTYADNYAVGYFKKQGFSREITLPRSVWAGYIKDYEGGTIMQCTMLRKVDYLRTKEIIERQSEAAKAKTAETDKSHLIVYPGLKLFKPGETKPLDPKDIPGLRETGWTLEDAKQPAIPRAKIFEFSQMQKLLSMLKNQSHSYPFNDPVDTKLVHDYLDYIKTPMDFGTMETRLKDRIYTSMDEFLADAQLVFDNARTYNPPESKIYEHATDLERMMKDWLAENTKRRL